MKSTYEAKDLFDRLAAGDILESDGARFRLDEKRPKKGEREWNPGWGLHPTKPWLAVGPSGAFSIRVVEVTCDDPNELDPHQVEKWWSLQPASA